MCEVPGCTHKVRPGDQRAPLELQTCECTEQGSLHCFIPGTTQQPQTSLHQGVFFSTFSNFIQISIIYLQFPFSLCHTVPMSFLYQPAPSAPNTMHMELQRVWILLLLPDLPANFHHSRMILRLHWSSKCILETAGFLHVKSPIVLYSCFSSFSFPHICSSSPLDIICKYFPYPRSLMKMLINARAHAVVTHQ